MKPGSITVPVKVNIEFVGTDADIGRLVNRCLAAEALAESRRVQLDRIRDSCYEAQEDPEAEGFANSLLAIMGVG